MRDIFSVGILGTGSAVPEKILTNQDFEKIVDTTDEWITTRTGIKERRICSPEQASSDLAIAAGKKAIEMAGITPQDLDLIVCATFTGDTPCPATACHIQYALGNNRCAAFDVNAACSGFIYGCAIAKGLINIGTAKYALVIGVDTLSKYTDYQDRGTCVLFGDAAGAAVIGPVEDNKGFLAEYLGADGSLKDLIIVPAGGSRKPASIETVSNREHYVKMAGNEVFKFAVRIMNHALEKALEKCGLSASDLDWVIPHQANIRILESAARKLNIPIEKMWINIDKYGNSSAGTVPLALDEAIRSGRLKKGHKVALVAFGAGLTWGASIFQY